MQYVWRFRLLPRNVLTAQDGRVVEILDPGELNTGSGPDFFNAKIRLDGRVWAGNVEVHVHAADWFRHHHDVDPAYDNVILHVVAHSDADIPRRTDGVIIPQVVMDDVDRYRARYDAMLLSPLTELPCADTVRTIPLILLSDWLTAMGMQRLQGRADAVRQRLHDSRGDWASVVYTLLARALGCGANADAMERVARAVPLEHLLAHTDDAVILEAMLLGTAGLLQDTPRDDYEALLLREYEFHAFKYDLHPVPNLQWNRRRRPQNAPERRLAALAGLLADCFAIADVLLGTDARVVIDAVAAARMSPYWAEHLNLGAPPTPRASAAFSRELAQLLCINVAAPLMYAAAEERGDYQACQRAVDLLESLPAERNTVTRIFSAGGLTARDAFTGQALLQLRTCYCAPRKCLYCRIGHRAMATRP